MTQMNVFANDGAVIDYHRVAMFDLQSFAYLRTGSQLDAQNVFDDDAIDDHERHQQPPAPVSLPLCSRINQTKERQNEDDLYLSPVGRIVLKNATHCVHPRVMVRISGKQYPRMLQ